MNTVIAEPNALPILLRFQATVTYEQYEKEREQILRIKWLLSEKAGADAGFDAALDYWTAHHREDWMREQRAPQKATHRDASERDQVDRANQESAAA
jgi:hypothetical protein